MSQAYALHVLRVAVARICQTIGWHSTHTTTMDLLIDVTQHFLREISRIMQRYCELYNRTEPNLDDLALAYRDIGINMQELMEYIQFVDPINLPFGVPRFPLPRESNLNFLKPGSREMMKRPLHIPWYMPPMYPELEEAEQGDGGTELGTGEEGALVSVDPDASPRHVLETMKSVLHAADGLITSLISDTAESRVEGATLTEITIDGTAENVEIADAVPLIEEGVQPPEALVNEEIEIPMQTVDTKEPPVVATPDPSDPPVVKQSSSDVPLPAPADEGIKKMEPPQTAKDKPAQVDAAGGSKGIPSATSATAGEGRPTRCISSVIMTTSGFISPAREGKLPDSRIPVIPEERHPKLLQPPSAAMPAPPTVPPVPASGVGSLSSSGVAAGTSANGSHLPVAIKTPSGTHVAAGRDTSIAGTGGHFDAQAKSSPSNPLKPGGEKSGRKLKKKPLDRERKKGDKKGNATGPPVLLSFKGTKPPDVEPGSGAFPGEQGGSEGKEWSVRSSASLPPAESVPSVTAGSAETEAQQPLVQSTDAQATGTFVTAPITPVEDSGALAAKPRKPLKTKQGKEKVLKKRKALSHVVGDAGGGIIPGDIALTTPELFDKLPPVRPPKVKASTKRLKQGKKVNPLLEQPLTKGEGPAPNYHPEEPVVEAGGSNQPPPLIDPWRYLASGAAEKVAGLSGAVSPLEVARSYGGTPKHKPATGKKPRSESASEQAAQLSMLQAMHPSLEITATPATPAPDRPHKQPGASKKSAKAAKEAKVHSLTPPPVVSLSSGGGLHDRDVIVIDDDKSPPRTPSIHVSPSGAPAGGKKQRKQQPPGSTKQPPDAVFPVGSAGFAYEYGGAGDLLASPASAHLSFRDFSSPDVHGSSIPKTPDIKLQSSSSSSTSLMSDTGRAPGKGPPPYGAGAGGSANLFSELASTSTPSANLMLPKDGPLETVPTTGGKKQKRPKQKPPKDAPHAAKKMKHGAPEPDQPSQDPESPAVAKNPFALFAPGGSGGLGPYGPSDAHAYGNYLNPAVAGIKFGMFPFSSGPGLIPDNPIFPRLPNGSYPLGPGGFPMGRNLFGLPGLPGLPGLGQLMRMQRPLTASHSMMGGAGSLHHQRMAFDDNLDPETKLAQTPLDLQKSTCNVAPLVPPSLFESVAEESLNLSLKLGPLGGSGGTDGSSATATTAATVTAAAPASQGSGSASFQSSKKEATAGSTAQPTTATSTSGGGGTGGSSNVPASTGTSSTSSSNSQQQTALYASSASLPSNKQQSSKPKEDQVVILPAASFLPGASPPQRSSLCVIDVDDSDGSQSTATTGGKSKDGRRKSSKEHKKNRKLKDGKLKKKKDKKDKSKSREREREQQLKELTAGTASSSGVMTMGMIGAEEVLMEQLRKERKEKKEKRKEKLKKEKRKERERLLASGGGGAGGESSKGTPGDAAGEAVSVGASVPKLMLKLGGSNATPSPRSDTPEHHAVAGATVAPGEDEPLRRDGSPELARISALVTRPPKLKPPSGASTAASSKDKKDDSPTKGGKSGSAGGPDGGPFLQAAFDTANTGLLSSGRHTAVGDTPTGSGPPPAGGIGKVGGPSGTAAAAGGGALSISKSSKASRSVGGEYSVAPAGSNSSSSSSKATSSGDAGSCSKKASKDSSSKGASSSKSSSSAYHHHHHAAASAIAAPAHMTDVDGNTVWICPACGRVDDGTPMIGCDGCDAWYHWVCVGIQVPPDDNEDWYCRVCIAKKQDSHTDTEKQRKRKKKDKKNAKD